jgi:hypothetical protein
MDNSANAIVPPEPPGTCAGNAGRGRENNGVAAANGKNALDPTGKIGRILRPLAGLVGICLVWPGSWAIYEISNENYPASRVPLSNRAETLFLAVAIWAISISLMRFAFKNRNAERV